MEAERLPDLHVARAGHSLFCAGGELTVVGGHTSGFVPTATAEYYADGEWHLLPTVYTHDDGCSFCTPQGQVIIAGGHNEPLGIGQTFCVERYDPASHMFEGFGCLNTKRSLVSAAPIDSGRVIISGNWYHDDAIELFDGDEHFSHVGHVSVERMRPFIFPTSDGDALIFGSYGSHDSIVDCSLADRIFGPPLRLPLFEQWQPTGIDVGDYHTSDCYIGRTTDGACSYLLPVSNAEGQMAIALLSDTVASLLPTACPIPNQGPGGNISWVARLVADTIARQAYMAGTGHDNRLYVLSVAYAERPSALTLFYTDALPAPAISIPVLMPDGRLAIVGGNTSYESDTARCNNYSPFATAYLLSMQPTPSSATTGTSWPWWLATALLAIGAVLAFVLLTRKKKEGVTSTTEIGGDNEAEMLPTQDTDEQDDKHEFFVRICYLMEQEQLYLKSNLKVSDVAALLDTSSNFVSKCIKAGQGIPFSQFVNNYRIARAQQLLLQHPNTKMSNLCAEAGFANEMSFFRTFKTVTGLTPREWLRTKGA